MADSMACYVYRSRRKPGAFLFVPGKDDFGRVPEALLQLFGTPEFSFQFDLHPDRPLMIKAEAREVMRLLRDNGFFLQLPPPKEETYGH